MLLRFCSFTILATFCFSTTMAQTPKTDKLLVKILDQSEKLKPILEKKQEYEIQLIYTQINRDAQNRPKFKTYVYNHNPEHYFYPASTVKLPAILVALEKINELNINNLTSKTPLHIERAFAGHEAVDSDSTSENGKASIEHYAKKIALVSDNDAFNRLYDFLGQEYFNEKLQSKGYKNTRIVHRLEAALTVEQNQQTPEVWFGSENRIFTQPAQKATKRYVPAQPIRKGIGYLKNDVLVNEPFDFTYKNCFGLEDQHELLKAILFPDDVSPEKRFQLTENDYAFLYKYMSMLPKESSFPKYDYWDSYVKFLLFGDSKETMPSTIRIFNKVGDAYGFLIDNAYVVDFENKVEFMLSAVIHTNKNKIYNDGIYEYEEIGLPFMAEVGKTIYNFERKRKKKYLPNLEKFTIKY